MIFIFLISNTNLFPDTVIDTYFADFKSLKSDTATYKFHLMFIIFLVFFVSKPSMRTHGDRDVYKYIPGDPI